MIAKIQEIILEPTRRTIFVGDKHFFLSFPIMKFEIYIQKVGSYIRFEFLKLKIYIGDAFHELPFLPNMFFSGNLCLSIVNEYFEDTEQLQSAVIEAFWTEKFSSIIDYDVEIAAISDFAQYVSRANLDYFGYFELWEKKTKENPRWVPGLDFFKV
jgi:hypothetical protein